MMQRQTCRVAQSTGLNNGDDGTKAWAVQAEAFLVEIEAASIIAVLGPAAGSLSDALRVHDHEVHPPGAA